MMENEPKPPSKTYKKPPKRIPFKCVVCNGFGTLKHGELQCHACSGKGFVVVSQEESNEDTAHEG